MFPKRNWCQSLCCNWNIRREQSQQTPEVFNNILTPLLTNPQSSRQQVQKAQNIFSDEANFIYFSFLVPLISYIRSQPSLNKKIRAVVMKYRRDLSKRFLSIQLFKCLLQIIKITQLIRLHVYSVAKNRTSNLMGL